MDTKAIKAIFDEIEQKTQHKNYIFRGESQEYNECSSTLYRAYKTRIEYFDSPPSDKPDMDNAKDKKRTKEEEIEEIKKIEKEIIDAAKGHELDTKLDDIDLESKIQHLGGYTNLIDFTKSFLIAIFFACDKDSNEDGRVILQEINSDIECQMIKPQIPQNRIIAQKSVFVKPPTGVIPITETVTIPCDLKGDLRKYLKVNYDISRETIYNDLHGYIQHVTKKTQGQFLHVQYITDQLVEKKILLTPESWNEIKEISEKCINKHYTDPMKYLIWALEVHIYLCKHLKGFDKGILPIDTDVNPSEESKERMTIVLKKGQESTKDPEGDPVYMSGVSIKSTKKEPKS